MRVNLRYILRFGEIVGVVLCLAFCRRAAVIVAKHIMLRHDESVRETKIARRVMDDLKAGC